VAGQHDGPDRRGGDDRGQPGVPEARAPVQCGQLAEEVAASEIADVLAVAAVPPSLDGLETSGETGDNDRVSTIRFLEAAHYWAPGIRATIALPESNPAFAHAADAA
jgi:hypothetical protein